MHLAHRLPTFPASVLVSMGVANLRPTARLFRVGKCHCIPVCSALRGFSALWQYSYGLGQIMHSPSTCALSCPRPLTILSSCTKPVMHCKLVYYNS